MKNEQFAGKFPVVFLNGDKELEEKGRRALVSRHKDLFRFLNFQALTTREQLDFLEELGYYDPDADTDEDTLEELKEEAFSNYGLCFDYVEPGTFTDQTRGYYRFQLSWGGGSEEIRFYRGQIVFVYLDWFVGVGFDVSGDDVFQELYDYFAALGMLNRTDYAD